MLNLSKIGQLLKSKSLSLRSKLALLFLCLVIVTTLIGILVFIALISIPLKVEMGREAANISLPVNLLIFIPIAISLLPGLAGSFYLARRIKHTMLDLEIEEIVRLLEERTAIIQGMDEGVIAIDKENRITIVNEETKRVLNVGDEVIGRRIEEVIEDPFLPRVVASGKPQFNQERLLNNNLSIVNRLPIIVRGEVVGAITISKRKTEVHRLAEELTGVKTFVEILRVQNHEHLNKLHAIAGLIQLGKPNEALDYIFDVVEEQQEITSFLTRNICDYSITGLLLGKYNRAKELKVDLAVDRHTRLESFPAYLDRGALTVVLGNLLENALDAAKEMEPPRRKVYFAMFDLPTAFTIKVQDLGKGIPGHLKEQIFKQGFTTKGEGRGIGLYLVKKHVNAAGGSISVDSSPDEGTTVTINIPKKPSGLR